MKTKKELIAEEKLIFQYPQLYKKYRSIGFPKEKAVQYIKKRVSHQGTQQGGKALFQVQHRYQMNINKPGVSGISISDIRRTNAVNNWINTMEKEGAIIDKGHTLKFPPDETLGRY